MNLFIPSELTVTNLGLTLRQETSFPDEARTRLTLKLKQSATFTLDWVAIGEQQPEVEHNFAGEKSDTGVRDGRRWRRGNWFQYSLNTRGEKAADLAVTYWGGDRDRTFEILANGTLLATEEFNRPQPGQFFDKRYPIPAEVLAAATDGRVMIKFAARPGEATVGIFEVRLMRPAGPAAQPAQP